MACPQVVTGSEFLIRALAHLDCQAQTLGSFGFQSLSQPGSPAGTLLTALLTLFVALYGIRLLFGPGDEPRDLVGAVIRIGIVLTMAVSWPAWRTAAYDTVLYGPAEIAASITPSTLPDPRGQLPQRLQAIDTGIAAFTAAGTGRQTGAILDEGAASGFRTIALEDEAGLGWSRTLFLAATIGPLAILRIAGGLLLALAPLLAALLLFEFSRGLFAGWIRGLVLTALGSLAVTVLLSVQIAVMEPWLADVLSRRALGYATPTAPTELLALVLAFAIASAGLLFVLAKVAFQNAWPLKAPARAPSQARYREPALLPAGQAAPIAVHSRALAISESVALQVRREESPGSIDRVRRIGFQQPAGASSAAEGTPRGSSYEPLGSGYRRTTRRNAGSQRQRDERR
jgi:type IV secretion system protein VirB6